MPPFTIPTIADFKAQFNRDFIYSNVDLTTVQDADITKALTVAGFNINQDLFDLQSDFSYCYLLLAAHYLVTNLRASSQGLSGQYNFQQSGKGVGSVSESFSIPQHILDAPELGMFAKTNYGAEYLVLMLPRLRG